MHEGTLWYINIFTVYGFYCIYLYEHTSRTQSPVSGSVVKHPWLKKYEDTCIIYRQVGALEHGEDAHDAEDEAHVVEQHTELARLRTAAHRPHRYL